VERNAVKPGSVAVFDAMSSLPRPSFGPEVGLDLRSRKKLRTRRALQEAALKLFAEQGYDETTVAQIAALAEVGERTFFVYFPSKEDVLFNGSHEGFAELEQLIQGAPSELSDLAAIEHALSEIHEFPEPREQAMHHRLTQLLVRAADASSVVRGKRMEYANGTASAAARALGRRHQEDPPSLATITTAEAAMRMFYLSVVEWSTAQPGDLVAIFRRRFQTLRDIASDPRRI
jgi:AcrR family transcriptional regulator